MPNTEERIEARRARAAVDAATIRKMQPVGTVGREYFPLADRARAAVAWVGNEKHNPGEPLHWARGKSDDHLDAMIRHATESEDWDTVALPDGRVFQILHAAEAAWRASALAQIVAEKYGGEVIRVINPTPTKLSDADALRVAAHLDIPIRGARLTEHEARRDVEREQRADRGRYIGLDREDEVEFDVLVINPAGLFGVDPVAARRIEEDVAAKGPVPLYSSAEAAYYAFLTKTAQEARTEGFDAQAADIPKVG